MGNEVKKKEGFFKKKHLMCVSSQLSQMDESFFLHVCTPDRLISYIRVEVHLKGCEAFPSISKNNQMITSLP